MDLRADGRRKYPQSRLLASSADRGWSTIFAELRSHPAGRITSAVQQNVEIVIAMDGRDDGSVVRTGAGRQQNSPSVPGTIWLAPIGVGNEEIVLSAPMPRTLHLYLPARQFNSLADEYNLPRSPVHSIQYIGGLADELIRQIGLSVLGAMSEETSTTRMFAETASLMLAARLAHNYADAGSAAYGIDTPHRLDNARLRRVLDYVDQHLEEEIAVATLAGVANLSVFHFTRMFTAAVGVPPSRYVGRRRLENAMAMLAVGKLSLSDIAHRSCFASQASFSRAFRRATGMTPGEYRRLMR
jgi:AraC family transcriptional regulator